MTTSTKTVRNKHGISLKPIQCTRVYSRPIDGFEHCTAESFLFVDDNKGVVVQGNVYDKGDGNGKYLGRNYDATKYTKGLDKALTPDQITKAIKNHSPVGMTDLAEIVPLASAAPAATETPAPPAPAPEKDEEEADLSEDGGNTKGKGGKRK